MDINGMEQLSKYVPDLNTKSGRTRVGLYALGWFLLVTFYFVVSDHIPTWSIDSEIVVIALGFIVLRLFFTRKKVYQEKYKELAYRNACVHYGIPGLAIIMAAVAHAGYMNGPFVPRGWWTVVIHYIRYMVANRRCGVMDTRYLRLRDGQPRPALRLFPRRRQDSLTRIFTRSCDIPFTRARCA